MTIIILNKDNFYVFIQKKKHNKIKNYFSLLFITLALNQKPNQSRFNPKRQKMSYDSKYNANNQSVYYGNQAASAPSAPYGQIYPSASTSAYPMQNNANNNNFQNNQQLPAQPPPYSLNPDHEKAQKEHKYREIINKYEISHFLSQKLQVLF